MVPDLEFKVEIKLGLPFMVPDLEYKVEIT